MIHQQEKRDNPGCALSSRHRAAIGRQPTRVFERCADQAQLELGRDMVWSPTIRVALLGGTPCMIRGLPDKPMSVGLTPPAFSSCTRATSIMAGGLFASLPLKNVISRVRLVPRRAAGRRESPQSTWKDPRTLEP